MPEPAVQDTKSYYEEYPFIEGGPQRIAWWRDYLREFLPDEQVKGRLIGDIGSGVGEISRGLIDRGGRLVSLDVTLAALKRNREINPEAVLFNGSALDLPFADEAFDHAISIGVLMLTPNCRRGIEEVARVTAPGGTVVLFIYNYWSYLNAMYRFFAPIRKSVPLGKVPGWIVRMMQPFLKSHLNVELDEPGLRRLLGDKLWTPHATFHTRSELERWGHHAGITPVQHKLFYHNYAHVMSFQKGGAPRATPASEIVLRCVSCRAQPIHPQSGRYDCPGCGRPYTKVDGIYRCLV